MVAGFGETTDEMDVVVVTVVIQAGTGSTIMDLDNHYRHTERGLDNVYLANGFESVELGLMVARLERPLAGAELRFLRERLEMTQEEFAKLMGCSDGQQLGAWERGKSKAPRPVETLLRELYLEAYPPDQPAGLRQLLAQLTRTVDVEPKPVTLRESDDRRSSEGELA